MYFEKYRKPGVTTTDLKNDKDWPPAQRFFPYREINNGCLPSHRVGGSCGPSARPLNSGEAGSTPSWSGHWGIPLTSCLGWWDSPPSIKFRWPDPGQAGGRSAWVADQSGKVFTLVRCQLCLSLGQQLAKEHSEWVGLRRVLLSKFLNTIPSLLQILKTY